MVKKCIIASGLVIRNGKILFVRHRKLGVWLYPGGHVKKDEFPSEAVIRETKEETGFDVEIVSDKSMKVGDGMAHNIAQPFVIMLENVPYKDGPHTHFDMLYVTRIIGGRQQLDEKESDDIRWFSIDDLRTLDTYANVVDVAIAALEKYGG
ncbi:MAG: NUDIX domain-containing protein [Candidatus Marsarchaeota archaeon]|nr:NUDIX domain-containing protein [Candidatus Marsarchaeota archaeon]